MAIIVGDAMALQQRHHPQMYLIFRLTEKIKGLPLKEKIISKPLTKEGFYQLPSPLIT